VTRIDPADDSQKLAFDLQKHTHVEDPAQGYQHAGHDAQATAVLTLEVFRHGHQFQLAEAADDETGATDDDHNYSLDHRCGKIGDPVLVAEFAVIHKCDGANL